MLQPAEMPIEHNPAPTFSQERSRNVMIAVAALCGVLALGAVIFWFVSSGDDNSEPPAAEATALASDGPLPQEWFDGYTDKFLGTEIEQLAVGAAQKRNFPTTRGSQPMDKVARGTIVRGRWVEGADAKSKWLKTSDGGYIWEGNLGDPQQISSLGMAGFVAGESFNAARARFKPEGRYGSQDMEWETNACEIYESEDGLVDAMVSEGKMTRFETVSERLETGSGIRVGSSERALKQAYGASKLKREENPYSGFDYFYWASKDRGIKFHIEDGKVTGITAGDESIRYVEGCL